MTDRQLTELALEMRLASGFLSEWARSGNLKNSVIMGSANASSVVMKIGAKAGILYAGTVLHAMPIQEREL